MNKKYIVTLTQEERVALRKLIASGKGSARKLVHARILLKADRRDGTAEWKDAWIAGGLEVSIPTIEQVRQRFVEEGLEAALGRRKPQREYRRKLEGKEEAHLIALACGEPPAGRSRWTLRLLADRMVALEHVDTVSYETVRRVLKKTNLSLG